MVIYHPFSERLSTNFPSLQHITITLHQPGSVLQQLVIKVAYRIVYHVACGYVLHFNYSAVIKTGCIIAMATSPSPTTCFVFISNQVAKALTLKMV